MAPPRPSSQPAPAGASAFLAALAAGGLAFTPTSARAQARPEPRELLVLTDAHVEAAAVEATAQAHWLFQMPWNHLGLAMHLRYLAAGAPPDVDPTATRAIVLHLVGNEPAPAWLWPWLWRQRHLPAVRFALLGSLQPLDRADRTQLAAWLADFGLEFEPSAIDDPIRVRCEQRSQPLCSFEARPAELRHLGPSNRAATNTVWVATHDLAAPDDVRAAVVTGPRFALALDPYVMLPGSGRGDRRWLLDPFAFFRTAFDLDGVPAPDPSVAWGRRKFVLHVDGDAFENMSAVAPEQDNAAVFLERIAKATPIPMTVSVIVRSVTDDLEVAAPTPAMRLAQQLFLLPWVESASHTVLHPLDWRKPVTPRMPPHSVLWYDADSLAHYRHDMRAEVTESLRFMQRLVPPGRPCRLLFWSGASNPTADVVAACTAAGALNLNGGLFRCDPTSPSIGNVSPWGLEQDGTFQVYSGAANENVYDGFYTTTPTAFRHVAATFEATGAPRILKPVDLYAHFYSCEQPARLQVLQDLIEEWAFRRPTVPVPASDYAAAVVDAQQHCAIDRTATGFRFRAFTDCRTVRIDRPAQNRRIDWQRSNGVLGANTIGDALYLQLAAGDAELVWTGDDVRLPHLVEADHALAEVERDAAGLRWRSRAFRARHVVVGGLPSGLTVDYRVGGALQRALADADGHIAIELPTAGDDRVEVPTP